MKRILVRYTVKPDRLAEHEALLHAVFAALHEAPPDGLRYAAFRQDDGRSFVHLASIETPDGSNPLLALPAFRAFSERIAERCDAPPASTSLATAGAFRLLDPDPSAA